MIVILLTTLGTLLLSVIAFHYLFIRTERLSEKQWEAVDYVWYGFGAAALLFVVVELGRSHDISALEGEIKYAERAQLEIRSFVEEATPSVCQKSKALCNVMTDTEAALSETAYSLDWPLGPVIFEQREYRSWNEFLVARANHYKAEGIPQFLLFHTTMLLDLRSNLRERQKNSNHKYVPLWLRTIWPYILAVVIGLRITKVTHKVRRAH